MAVLDDLRITHDEQRCCYEINLPSGTTYWVTDIYLVDKNLTIEQYANEHYMKR
jgi:hypothetical protein